MTSLAPTAEAPQGPPPNAGRAPADGPCAPDGAPGPAAGAPRNDRFHSNHASNCLPLAGTLPKDRDALPAVVAAARAGA